MKSDHSDMLFAALLSIGGMAITWLLTRWYYIRSRQDLAHLEKRAEGKIEAIAELQRRAKESINAGYEEENDEKVRRGLLLSTISKLRSDNVYEKRVGLLESRELDRHTFSDNLLDVLLEEHEVSSDTDIRNMIRGVIRHFLR